MKKCTPYRKSNLVVLEVKAWRWEDLKHCFRHNHFQPFSLLSNMTAHVIVMSEIEVLLDMNRPFHRIMGIHPD